MSMALCVAVPLRHTRTSLRNELTGSSCHGSGESRLPAEQSSQTLGQFPLQGHERSSFRDTLQGPRDLIQACV